MRVWLAALFLTVFAVFSAAVADDAAEIRSVIEDQIAAFKADDGARAFSHASPSIQTRFGNPANFMNMVKKGYPQVYRPRAVEFQRLHQDKHLNVQEVFFFGQNGSAVVARYFLQRNADGVWKITGVDLRKAPELGA